MIVVVDYGRGNLFSLSHALQHLGIRHEVSDDPRRIDAAERIVLPGVGAFGDAMDGLRQRSFVDPLLQAVAAGKPLLGICVGCQLLLREGEEFGRHQGLGVIAGAVRLLPRPRPGDTDAVRLPNVGWRRLCGKIVHPVLDAGRTDPYYYFVHSFAPFPDKSENIAATCRINGVDVPVAVTAGSVLGVQFHPEKSGPAGLRMLERFASATLQ